MSETGSGIRFATAALATAAYWDFRRASSIRYSWVPRVSGPSTYGRTYDGRVLNIAGAT